MGWHIGIVEVGYIPSLPWSIYVPDAPPDAVLDVPCYCYFVTDGSTVVLVDSGADPAAAAMGGLAIVGGGQPAIDRALASEGIRASDVDYILHTHLHYDHVENDRVFPRANVVVQRRELEWARSPKAGAYYVGIHTLIDELGDRLSLVEGELEILRGITLVPNGGHTPGHQSVLVRTREEMVCLCGDIVPMRVNLEIICSVTPDIEATRQFLERARTARWTMMPSHDPELRQHPWLVPGPSVTSA
jgi:glyoxylase-like metal-dependent hydrolase (beta-lactamase superfamily II)